MNRSLQPSRPVFSTTDSSKYVRARLGSGTGDSSSNDTEARDCFQHRGQLPAARHFIHLAAEEVKREISLIPGALTSKHLSAAQQKAAVRKQRLTQIQVCVCVCACALVCVDRTGQDKHPHANNWISSHKFPIFDSMDTVACQALHT